MQVTYIPSDEVNSDLGIVNAARVSLYKKSHWYCAKHMHDYTVPVQLYEHDEPCERSLHTADVKLIHYLAEHKHWTPFAHARMYFHIRWLSEAEELHFYRNYSQAGMVVDRLDKAPSVDILKGSLYAWSYNVDFLPAKAQEEVYWAIQTRYPEYYNAIHLKRTEPFRYNSNTLELSEAYVLARKLWRLATVTLLLKVPIFVARQIRTSQVGLAYNDLYVESEAFCYNEVSRRYVSEEPEFYNIQQWRVREGKSIKQGSTGIASEILQAEQHRYQDWVHDSSLSNYRAALEQSIAPEQARALLPQSLYTEFYMTGTLHRWAQWLKLRLQPDVQQETQAIANTARVALTQQFPEWAEAYQLS